MSTANKTVQAFIALNTTAVAAATKVFAAIESQSDLWVEALAKAGIMGADIKVYAVVYVTEQSGKMPKPSQRGGLTFDKGTTEYNRVEYLVKVASGAAAVKAANRSAGKTDVVAKLLKAYADLTPAQKKAFKAAI
jgi:hypothetical protein